MRTRPRRFWIFFLACLLCPWWLPVGADEAPPAAPPELTAPVEPATPPEPAEPAAPIEIMINGIAVPEVHANALAYLSLQRQQAQGTLTAERIPRLHRLAPEEIKKSAHVFGYYRAEVQSELREPADGKPWQAVYQVELGAAVTLAKVQIEIRGEGEQDEAFQTLQLAFPLKVGDALHHGKYEQAKRDLRNLAEERGYFESSFGRSQLQVDMQAYSAAILIEFNTGPRYVFGAIQLNHENFEAELIQRYVPFQTGDPYRSERLQELRNNMAASGYFKSIEIQTRRQPQAQPPQIDITVNFDEGRLNTYRMRLGYGTDSGVRAGLDWGRSRVTDSGHRINAQARARQTDNKLLGKIEYLIPTGKPEEEYLSIALRYEGEDFSADKLGLGEGGTTRAQDFSLMLSKYHPRRLGDWRINEIVGLEYLMESYDLLSLMASTPEELRLLELLLKQEDIRALTVLRPEYYGLIPGITWSYSESDNPIYPRNGHLLRLRLRGAHEGWLSNFSFLQAQLTTHWIFPALQGDRLILRSDMGYTDVETVDLFNANMMPNILNYKTGGDTSVRGYGFEDLDGGTLAGGRHLLVGSVEYERRILEKWSLAAFVDAGNAFNYFSDMDLHTGVGGGVRWHSPVGLVRLDVGFALDNSNEWRVHLNIGPDF
jgi:translocation and assembly module TamA